MTKRDTGHSAKKPQLLHLVFGGELTDLESHEFRDLHHVDVIGVFPNYETAYAAWKGAAQSTVDNAMVRYFIVHLHRLLSPELTAAGKSGGGHTA